MKTKTFKIADLTPRQKITALRWQLSQDCLEREIEIDACLAGLLSGLPVALFGPPGTGKTMLVELLAKGIGGRYFYWLHNPTTKPDDVFGPVDIAALKERSIYRRNVKGKAPDAHIVALDEFGKASSAIRNAYLRIMNERRFANPDDAPVPTEGFFGMSNEVPSSAEDAAFMDRFACKLWVEDIQGKENRRQLQQRALSGYRSAVTRGLFSRRDLKCARAELCEVEVPLDPLATAEDLLRANGIRISTRRSVQILRFLQAVAWLRGEPKVSRDTFREFYPLCAWNALAEKEKADLAIADRLEQWEKAGQRFAKAIAETNFVLGKNKTDLALRQLNLLQGIEEELKNSEFFAGDLREALLPQLPDAIARVERFLQEGQWEATERQAKEAIAQATDLVESPPNNSNWTSWVERCDSLTQPLKDCKDKLETFDSDEARSRLGEIENLKDKIIAIVEDFSHAI